jgi:hypothetical protein
VRLRGSGLQHEVLPMGGKGRVKGWDDVEKFEKNVIEIRSWVGYITIE